MHEAKELHPFHFALHLNIGYKSLYNYIYIIKHIGLPAYHSANDYDAGLYEVVWILEGLRRSDAYRWHIQLHHCSLDNHELYYTAWCRGYRIHPHTGTHQDDMSAGLGVHKSQPHIHENWLTSYINITVKMWPFDLMIKQLEGHQGHFKEDTQSVKCTFFTTFIIAF